MFNQKDEWKIIEEKFQLSNNYKNESIFTVGNGKIGFRGDFEEGLGENESEIGFSGNYINGFYDTESIKYGEHAYGFAKYSQTMLNVCNGRSIKLFLDDEEFSLTKGQIIEYSRELDMKEGILSRKVHWRSKKGKEIIVNINRLVSFTDLNIAAIEYSVESINFHGDLIIVTDLNGNVRNKPTGDDPRVGSGLKDKVLKTEKIYVDRTKKGNKVSAILQSTKKTQLFLACAVMNEVEADSIYETEDIVTDTEILNKYIFNISAGKSLKLRRYISYHTSLDSPETELLSLAENSVEKATKKGIDNIKQEQRDYLERFWKYSDIEIKGNLELQQAIRFNIFQLLQSTGKNGKTSIAAKGITGEGYEGHYFWESETYIMPVFMCSAPLVARKLLEYRYSILDKAREQARLLGHEKGALYSWRSINGEECSAYFPAGSAQYHISADIAYGIKRYFETTDDIDFLLKYGAEIIFETARLWLSVGHFNKRKNNKFCIDCVTGPDEYTAIVNNNCYTNALARENLLFAYELGEMIKESYKVEYNQITEKIALTEGELRLFKKAGENMYIPYDNELGIHMQDDSFLEKKIWDIKSIPKDKHPLLLHYHPLHIYRHQICKQADLILAEFLVGERFTASQKKRDFEYYEKVTTHDSSLSASVFSIMASEINYRAKAYDYFIKTARMDLDDTHNNTKDGLHMANMAGTWACVVNGFGGMRISKDRIAFKPYLPKEWKSYKFRTLYKNSLIEVRVNNECVQYELLEGKNIEIYHNGISIQLFLGKVVTFQV